MKASPIILAAALLLLQGCGPAVPAWVSIASSFAGYFASVNKIGLEYFEIKHEDAEKAGAAAGVPNTTSTPGAASQPPQVLTSSPAEGGPYDGWSP